CGPGIGGDARVPPGVSGPVGAVGGTVAPTRPSGVGTPAVVGRLLLARLALAGPLSHHISLSSWHRHDMVAGTGVTRRAPGRGWIRVKLPVRGKEFGAMAEEIRAEMVANVWKVVATEGAEVAEGDTLVILESMKMEIPVVAESDGTLAKLAVNEGDVVQ